MKRSASKRGELLAVLFVLICAQQALGLVNTISYGEVHIDEAKITILYTKDVYLVRADLSRLNPDSQQYELVQDPPKDPESPQWIRQYTLYPGTEDVGAFIAPGTYELYLEAQDRQGKLTADIVRFSRSQYPPGLQIALIDPPFGLAQAGPFQLYFTTHRAGQPANSSCSYSKTGFSQLTPLPGGTANHFVPIDYNGHLFLACADSEGIANATFVVGWITQRPQLNVTASPEIIVDRNKQRVSFTARTDQRTICFIDAEPFFSENPQDEASYRTVHETALSYNHQSSFKTTKLHEIACSNLAGLSNSTQVNITIDFNLSAGIDVLSPQQLINTSSFELVIRPTFPADACTANGDDLLRNQQEFRASYSGRPDGGSNLSLACTGLKQANRTYRVTIDTAAPIVHSIAITSCTGDFSATVNASDAGSGIASYTYTISDDEGEILTRTVTGSAITAPTNGMHLNGTPRWSIAARDVAGNKGAFLAADIVCGGADLCTNNRLDPNETDIDCGGACPACETCVDDLDCFPDVCSANGNCIPSPLNLCSNGVLDTNETAIDCGGACPACTNCSSDAECEIDETCTASGYCEPIEVTPPNTCSSDFECEIDEVCSSGICVPPEDIPPSCSSSIECELSEECVRGVCVPSGGPNDPPPQPPQNPDEPAPEGGASWLGISLILLGIIVMGGAGWYLYLQHNLRKDGGAGPSGPELPRMPGKSAPPRSPLPSPGPAREAQFEREAQERRKQRHDVQHKQLQEAFSKFEEQPATKKQEKPQKQDDEEEVFDELEDIGK